MGLDMYLYKKTYVQQWKHNKPEDQFKVTVKRGGKAYKAIDPKLICYVTEQVGYWRKFNALHNWFVNECAEGVDDCKDVYVSETKMEELYEVLHKVQSSLLLSPKKTLSVKAGWGANGDIMEDIEVFSDTSVAEELFPSASGFFFGGTEYGEYYLEQVGKTIELVESLLAEPGGDFYYQASW
jgi:hypothetical protein